MAGGRWQETGAALAVVSALAVILFHAGTFHHGATAFSLAVGAGLLLALAWLAGGSLLDPLGLAGAAGLSRFWPALLGALWLAVALSWALSPVARAGEAVVLFLVPAAWASAGIGRALASGSARSLGPGGHRRDRGRGVGLGPGPAAASRTGPGRAADRAPQPVGFGSGGSPAGRGAWCLARDGGSWLAGGPGRDALRGRHRDLDPRRHRFDVRVGGPGRAGGGGRGVDPLAEEGAQLDRPVRGVAGSGRRAGARDSLGRFPTRCSGSDRSAGRDPAARGPFTPGAPHVRRGCRLRIRGAPASRLGSGVHELDSGEPLAAGSGRSSAGARWSRMPTACWPRHPTNSGVAGSILLLLLAARYGRVRLGELSHSRVPDPELLAAALLGLTGAGVCLAFGGLCCGDGGSRGADSQSRSGGMWPRVLWHAERTRREATTFGPVAARGFGSACYLWLIAAVGWTWQRTSAARAYELVVAVETADLGGASMAAAP